MGLITFLAAFIAASTLFVQSFALDVNSRSNLVVYWGQGYNQPRLSHFCQKTSFDIIVVGFINVFPDQHATKWPGSNFGNQCADTYYETEDGQKTELLNGCYQIKEDLPICKALGKTILLSLGGGGPRDFYEIKSEKSARDFADFLWSAFGPLQLGYTGPRPFGDASVDGFDLDIETGSDHGYEFLVQRLRWRFAEDPYNKYYISAAPQCILPDKYLSKAISSVAFDFIFVQFYNNPPCSAKAWVKDPKSVTYTVGDWAQYILKSKNPTAKLFIGLPGSETAANPGYYLTPFEASKILETFVRQYPNTIGGAMIWEATESENNPIGAVSYAEKMKEVLLICDPDPPKSTVTSSTMTSTSTTLDSSSTTVTTSTMVTSVTSSTTVTTVSTSSGSSTVPTSIRTTTVPVTTPTTKPVTTPTTKPPVSTKPVTSPTTKKPVTPTTKKPVPTPTPTKKPTVTTKKPVPTPTPTKKPTVTTKKPVPTPTKKPTVTTKKPVPTPTKKPTVSTKKPVPTPTKKPTVTTKKPVPTPTKKPVPTPTKKPTVSTKKPVPTPTKKPTVSTKKPVPTPTKKPIVSTKKPVPVPTKKPTVTTKKPVPTPTKKPTVSTKKPVPTPSKKPTVSTKKPVPIPTKKPVVSSKKTVSTGASSGSVPISIRTSNNTPSGEPSSTADASSSSIPSGLPSSQVTSGPDVSATDLPTRTSGSDRTRISTGPSNTMVDTPTTLITPPNPTITYVAPSSSTGVVDHTTITTIITTSYVTICPTGFSTVTLTYTTTYCPETIAPQPTQPAVTGIPNVPAPAPTTLPDGWTAIVTVCTQCAATPTTVTLTVPEKTAFVPQPTAAEPDTELQPDPEPEPEPVTETESEPRPIATVVPVPQNPVKHVEPEAPESSTTVVAVPIETPTVTKPVDDSVPVTPAPPVESGVDGGAGPGAGAGPGPGAGVGAGTQPSSSAHPPVFEGGAMRMRGLDASMRCMMTAGVVGLGLFLVV